MRFPDPRNLPYFLLRRYPLPPRLHWHLMARVNARFLAGVYGIVRDDRGRLLLCYHTYRAEYPWGLPGGWMIRGETPLAALEREVGEETGLAVSASRLLMMGVSPDRPKHEFVVGARLTGGKFHPSREVSAVQWWAGGEGPPPLRTREREILAQAGSLADGEVGWYRNPWEDVNPSPNPGVTQR